METKADEFWFPQLSILLLATVERRQVDIAPSKQFSRVPVEEHALVSVRMAYCLRGFNTGYREG